MYLLRVALPVAGLVTIASPRAQAQGLDTLSAAQRAGLALARLGAGQFHRSWQTGERRRATRGAWHEDGALGQHVLEPIATARFVTGAVAQDLGTGALMDRSRISRTGSWPIS